MQGEIRNLPAGRYYSDDEMILDIFKSDRGVHIIHADLDLDFCVEWIIGSDGEIVDHIVDTVSVQEEGQYE